MNITTISQSDVNLYDNCPLHYYFHKNNYPKIVVDSSKAQLGKAVHQTISDYYTHLSTIVKRGASLTPDDLEQSIKQLFENSYKPETPDLSRRYNQIIKNFTNFEVKRLTTLTPAKYLPDLVEAKLTNGNLVGIVDYYNQKTAEVIDWKTGNMTTLDESAYLQAKFYEYLLRLQNLEVKKVYFVALTTGLVLESPIMSDGWFKTKLENFIQSVSSDRFPAKPGSLCEYCDYILTCQTREGCIWYPTPATR